MKTIEEMIEVMQAYDRGEQIEESIDGIVWFACEPIWNWDKCDYRVKKKIYVSFETTEEFLAAQRKHNHGETIRCKSDGYLFRSFVNWRGDISLVNDDGYSLNENIGGIYGKYEFLDGTPCGKEVEV